MPPSTAFANAPVYCLSPRKRPRTSSNPASLRAPLFSTRIAHATNSRFYLITLCSADHADTNITTPPRIPATLRKEAPKETLRDAKLTFWAAALTEAAAAVFATGLCSLTGIPVLGKGWAFNPALLTHAIGVALPFSAVFWVLERAPTGIEAATEASFRSFFRARTVWEVALFCMCVSFGEEFLFRSWLLASLERWSLPTELALVGSSVVFGALHAYTRVYMVLASLAGLMFGGMFVASGESVLEPLVVHFLYDFCTILIMQRKWLASDEEP